MDFKPDYIRRKVDYFIDNQLSKTFNNLKEAAAEFNVDESNIRNILEREGSRENSIKFRKIIIKKNNVILHEFNSNIELIKYSKDNHNIELSTAVASRIVNNKVKKLPKFLFNCEIEVINNVPDLRDHVIINNIIIDKKICTYCEEEKPNTDNYFPYRNKIINKLHERCKDCRNERIGDRPIQDFLNELTEDWKHHEVYDFIYFEKETNKIFNTNTGNYLERTCIKINPNKVDEKNYAGKDLKWETFYGPIPENKIVKFKDNTESIDLNNLECVFVYCLNCDILIENPKTITRKYCSKICQEKNRRILDLEEKRTNLKIYLQQKIWSQNGENKKKYNNLVIDYDTDYLVNLGINCYYCSIECKFGQLTDNNGNHPDLLTYDKKNPDVGYCKDNIVSCCLFCNRMKNQTCYEDWEQLIQFLQDPFITELDLSNKTFTSKEGLVSKAKNGTYNHWSELKGKSPKYYTIRNSSYKTFEEIIIKQNKKDSIFNFFPIIYLNQNCLFNYSIDAINTKLPNEEKHRPDNIQVIPKFLNFAKNDIHSNELFLIEWNKRNFKNNFSNCSIKLPEKYTELSCLEERLKVGINKKIGKGKKGIANSREAIERGKQTKINNGTLLKGENHPNAKRIIRVDLKTKEEKSYGYMTLAAQEIIISGIYKTKCIGGIIGKIQMVADKIRNTAYGYSWKYV